MKCKLCDDQGQTKTEDGKDICLRCYHKIFNHLFKGNFTIKECTETNNFLKLYESHIKYYLMLLHQNGINIPEIIVMENNISIQELKKDRKTISKEEHVWITCMLMEYLELSELKYYGEGDKAERDTYTRYFNECIYLI